MKKFNELLLYYRKRAKISQKALADAADLNASHINRIERGLRNPPKKLTIIAMAKALMLDKQETIKLLRAAGYKIPLTEKLTPAEEGELDFALESPLDSDVVHPVVKTLNNILSDKKISVKSRRMIAENIEKFALWLYDEAKKEKMKNSKQK